MPSLRPSNHSTAQLVGTAVVSGAVVASLILGYQRLRREHNVDKLKHSIPPLDASHNAEQLNDFGLVSPTSGHLSKEDERSAALAARALKGDYDEELILEQLARNRVFLSDAGLAKLRAAKIVVVGCGGVGSHCAAALARSGAAHIRLIDFDQVSLSSLNRHAVATLADVGTPKVHCLKRRLHAIAPWVDFDCRNELFAGSEADRLLEGADFVIDAIDNIVSKVDLLAYCKNNDIPVISSMGAGCKSDPTRIFVGDISSSTDDPLSRSTRRRLRQKGISSGIPVVYSTEKPEEGKAQLLPLSDEEFAKGKVGELAPMADFRVRILPVLGTLPAIFGLTVANYVMVTLAGYPMQTVETKGRGKMYDGILALVQGQEEKIGRKTMDWPVEKVKGLKIPLTSDDVGYIVEEVYRGRSAISGVPTRLSLIRWHKPTEGSINDTVPDQINSKLRWRDLVCMTREEAKLHLENVILGDKTLEEMYDQETIQRVEARIQEEIAFEKYR